MGEVNKESDASAEKNERPVRGFTIADTPEGTIMFTGGAAVRVEVWIGEPQGPAAAAEDLPPQPNA